MSFPFHFLFIHTYTLYYFKCLCYGFTITLLPIPLTSRVGVATTNLCSRYSSASLVWKRTKKKCKTHTHTSSEQQTRHPPGPRNRLCFLISSPTCNMTYNNHPALHRMQSPMDTYKPRICSSSTSFQTIRQSKLWMEVEEQNRLFGLNERN